jgi:hypothetical protein
MSFVMLLQFLPKPVELDPDYSVEGRIEARGPAQSLGRQVVLLQVFGLSFPVLGANVSKEADQVWTARKIFRGEEIPQLGPFIFTALRAITLR